MKINKKNLEKKQKKSLQKTSSVIIKKKANVNVDKPKKNIGNAENSEKQYVPKTKNIENGKFNAKPPSESNEKTDWNKFKKEKKELKLKRKEGRYKDLSTLIKDTKIIYEKLKCRKTEKKNELASKLYNILTKADCLHKFVLAHDTSRIIQCLLKYSSPKVREELSLALLPVSVLMMQSRYAHFCVLRMLKYGSNTTKSKLIESLYGSVIKLCSHNISGKIMDIIYFEKATKKEKIFLKQEFYSDFFSKSKDANIKHLKDTYAVMPNTKNFVVSKLTHLVNKNAMDNSLVHEILLEYIEESSETDEKKEQFEEFLKFCIPIVPHIITTKSGSKSAIKIFWLSQTKERRAIIKTLKDHLLKIFTHEHGHQFILAIVNSLDDTKAVKKSIFDPLMANFNEIITNQYGRRVLFWFIAPADKEIFHPNLIKFLEDGLIYSKKDKILRRTEIYEQIEEPICEKIQEDPNFWLSNGNVGFVTALFLKQISVNKSNEIYSSLAKVITSSTWKLENAAEGIGIEDSGMHHAIKKIFKYDQKKLEKGEPTFGEELLKNVDDNIIELWIPKNRGCFMLVLLFEVLNEKSQEKLKLMLKSHTNILERLSHMGSQILLKKINSG